MKANIKHNVDGEPTSFIVNGDRTRWFWRLNDGVASFSRVEVKRDEHSTDTAVVLFGEEWSEMMDYVESLDVVDSTDVVDPIKTE
jgi:hypothetical protein